MEHFPRLEARDLDGARRRLPDDLSGTWSLVVVAFRRDQQALVDAWIEWHRTVAGARPSLRCVELPVLGTRWSPARPVIDGGMARAVRTTEAKQRTLTVYTDPRRVTDALAITTTDTITAVLVDAAGAVRWQQTGPFTPDAGAAVLAALDRRADDPAPTPGADPAPTPGADPAPTPGADPASDGQFDFAFDPRFRPALAALGVTPATAHATIGSGRLVARFGPWSWETPLANVTEVCVTGPYRWYTAIGARLSFADQGLTFGTTTAGGVCVLVREPVPGLLPFGPLRHPGITVTVAERDRFATTLRRAALVAALG